MGWRRTGCLPGFSEDEHDGAPQTTGESRRGLREVRTLVRGASLVAWAEDIAHCTVTSSAGHKPAQRSFLRSHPRQAIRLSVLPEKATRTRNPTINPPPYCRKKTFCPTQLSAPAVEGRLALPTCAQNEQKRRRCPRPRERSCETGLHIGDGSRASTPASEPPGLRTTKAEGDKHLQRIL